LLFRFHTGNSQLSELLDTISSFQGHSRWNLTDNCLVAAQIAEFVEFPSSQTISEAQCSLTSLPRFSREHATDDLLQLAELIEGRLGLKGTKSKLFSPDLITKEGLCTSNALFEDFQDGGQRIVYLIVKPGNSEIFEPTKADMRLHFEPSDEEITAVFNEILGVDLTQAHGRALMSLIY
jgi:hypothetical protein